MAGVALKVTCVCRLDTKCAFWGKKKPRFDLSVCPSAVPGPRNSALGWMLPKPMYRTSLLSQSTRKKYGCDAVFSSL